MKEDLKYADVMKGKHLNQVLHFMKFHPISVSALGFFTLSRTTLTSVRTINTYVIHHIEIRKIRLRAIVFEIEDPNVDCVLLVLYRYLESSSPT